MGGASPRHVTISLNVASALDDALEGSPCRAYMADMKVQAAEDKAYFYPDVLVTCDSADHRADQFMRAPKMIVEALSPKAYETARFPTEAPDPIDFLEYVMYARGLTQKDPEPCIGPRGRVAEIMSRTHPHSAPRRLPPPYPQVPRPRAVSGLKRRKRARHRK